MFVLRLDNHRAHNLSFQQQAAAQQAAAVNSNTQQFNPQNGHVGPGGSTTEQINGMHRNSHPGMQNGMKPGMGQGNGQNMGQGLANGMSHGINPGISAGMNPNLQPTGVKRENGTTAGSNAAGTKKSSYSALEKLKTK